MEDDDDEDNVNECQKILTIDPNSHHQGHLRQMLGSHQTTNLMLSNRSSNMNDYLLQTNDFDKDNLVDTDDETDPGDFISSTTSNLEFLKTHSLFNSTPLNYYPTLGLTGKE